MKHSSNPTFELLNRQWNSNISQQEKHRDKLQPVSIVTVVHHNLPDCTRSSVEVCELWHENRGPGWDTALPTSSKLDFLTENLCSHQPEMSCSVCTLLKYLVPMIYAALRTSNWSTCSTFLHNRDDNRVTFFFYLNVNNWKYISDFPLSHHHWQLYIPHWQLGSVWSTTPSGECWLSWEHILIFVALWASCYRLLLHCPNSLQKLLKGKINLLSIWGSNPTIRQITHLTASLPRLQRSRLDHLLLCIQFNNFKRVLQNQIINMAKNYSWPSMYCTSLVQVLISCPVLLIIFSIFILNISHEEA